MSSQPPYDPYGNPEPIPPTQYAPQSSEYVPIAPYPPVNPYDAAQPQPGYAPPPVYAPQPQYPPVYAPGMIPREPGRGQALSGMILGIIGLIAWIIPLFGFPVSIVGIILSVIGMRSVSRKNLAVAGLVLGIIALVLTFASCIWGAYVGSRGY